MKKTLLLIIVTLFSVGTFAQSGIQFPKSDTTSVNKDYPYILPIWGQKLTDKNIKFQLPFGLNANYVYNRMELEMTQFDMNLNDRPLEAIGLDEMGFKEIIAKTSGINVRADAWILPFLNFYGLYSENNGSTQVSMNPFDTGLIELDPVSFKSTTWGVGTTFIYGWNNYFVSVDANYTSSGSNILEDRVGFVVASARIGRRAEFDNGMALAVYFGAMYRDFVGHEANNGNVMLEDYIPELKPTILDGINGKIAINEDLIADRDYPYSVDDPSKVNLIARNKVLDATYKRIEAAPSSVVSYSIKKEIVNPWSTQIGFNWEITPNWMFRGETGYSAEQTFFMTGLQYRFGL
ncbi:MAG: hypothetical protein KAG37_07425 [Flavobacteriales bacterium]|nr:hypothetical protein [Flavobacteriales bacterium]